MLRNFYTKEKAAEKLLQISTLYSELKGHEPLVEVPYDSLYYNVKITAIRTFKIEHDHKLVPIPSVDLFAFYIVMDRPSFVK